MVDHFFSLRTVSRRANPAAIREKSHPFAASAQSCDGALAGIFKSEQEVTEITECFQAPFSLFASVQLDHSGGDWSCFMDKTNIANLSPEQRFLETKEIEIDGMTCDICVRTIEKALRGVDGVREVSVDRSRNRATVTFDNTRTNMPALHDILLSHGYRPTRFAQSPR